MTTNKREQKPHSAEYFGETRDYWWNTDFLELMATRLSLREADTILDVGCGVGHWGQLLARVFSENAQVTGIDREEVWVEKATQRARSLGLESRYHYQVGDVTAIPFSDNEFDLVTCQTVLIHLGDPKAGLREMLRVLKPGGIVLAAEPNNLSNRTTLSNVTDQFSVEEMVERFRFGLMVERGKQSLGLGFNSVGDLVPGCLTELGAESIQVYLSDKASPFFAPYQSKEQQVNCQQIREWTARGFVGWERAELLEYFLAGGGHRAEFERYYKLLLQDSDATVRAIDAGTYHSAGGAITYLVAAHKPRQ